MSQNITLYFIIQHVNVYVCIYLKQKLGIRGYPKKYSFSYPNIQGILKYIRWISEFDPFTPIATNVHELGELGDLVRRDNIINCQV